MVPVYGQNAILLRTDHVNSLASRDILTVPARIGYKSSAVSGSDYWMYDGKTLDEIRIAMEAEQESGA